MDIAKKFIPTERPNAKQHQKLETRMHEMDKRNLGGIFYTNDATQLHVNVLDSNITLADKILDKGIVVHIVKHSWDYLNRLQEAVTSLFGTHGIHMANMSHRYNRVIIGVDHLNKDIAEEIITELSAMGFDDMDAYTIEVKDRVSFPQFLTSPEDNHEVASSAILTEEPEEGPSNVIMPGGMLLVKNANGSFGHLCSLNFGYYYKGAPYLVGAGHACSASNVGLEAYYVPYDESVGGYPMSRTFLPTSYNAAKRFKLGTIRLRRLGGNYDLFTIGITESGLSFTRTPYNGYTISRFGGTVTEGSVMRICGMTTQYGTIFDYGACADAQASVSSYNTTMTNLIQLDIGANMGTSGGPICTVDADGSVRLVGLASVPGTGTCYGVSIQRMIDAYSLTVMEDGPINI